MIPEIEKLEGFEKIHPYIHSLILNLELRTLKHYEVPIYGNYSLFEYIHEMEIILEKKGFVKARLDPNKVDLIENENSAKIDGPKIQSALCDIFALRYFNGIIDTSFKEKYETGVKELHKTIIGLNLDINKFWYLLIFLKDFVDGLTTAPKTQNSAIADLLEIYNHLVTIDTRPNSVNNIDAELILKINGKAHSYNNPITLKSIAALIRHEQKNMIDYPKEFSNYFHHLGFEDDPNVYEDEAHMVRELIERDEDAIQYKQYFIKECIVEFFENHKSNKKKRVIIDGEVIDKISYDKMLFTSRIVYLFNYTSNENDINFYNEWNNEKINKSGEVVKNDKLKNSMNSFTFDPKRFPISCNINYKNTYIEFQ